MSVDVTIEVGGQSAPFEGLLETTRGAAATAEAFASSAGIAARSLTALQQEGYASLSTTADHPLNEWDLTAGFGGMTMAVGGAELGAGAVVEALRLPFQAAIGADTMRLTMRTRLLVSAHATDVPGSSVDTVLFTILLPLSQLGVVPGAALADVLIGLPNPINADLNLVYLATFEALNGATRVASGYRHGLAPSGATDWRGGWYASTPTFFNWNRIAVASPGSAPVLFWQKTVKLDLSSALGRTWDSRDQVTSCTAAVANYKVTLSNTSLLRAALPVAFDGSVTHVAPASGKQRLDIIALNPETLALSIVAGVERSTDAAEVPPSVASGLIRLYAVLVTTGNVSLAPTWMLEDGTVRSLASGRRADIARGRRAIANTLSAATRGQPITHICETDSIGAWSNSTADANYVPSNTVPNGPHRDLKDYLSNPGYPQLIANDVINALPTFDHADGLGRVHLHASKYRLLSDALGRWGSDVQHLNFGLAGTASGGGKSGVTGMSSNGRDPDLLNAVLAAVAAAIAAGRTPVVSLGYGMNECGSPATEVNIVAIAAAVYAAGGDVIVWGCPRPNPAGGIPSVNWRYTCRALRRAAEYVDLTTSKSAAYIDTVRISDDPAIGAIGMPVTAICTVNTNNHPGIAEHRREAREAIDLVGYA